MKTPVTEFSVSVIKLSRVSALFFPTTILVLFFCIHTG